jgi:hypothetical protein
MAPPLTSAYGRSRWTPAERCAAEDAGVITMMPALARAPSREVWNRTGSVAAARATSAACVALDDLETFFALESSLRAREEPPREPPAVAESARYLAEFTRVWDRGELGYRTIVFQGRIAGFGGVQPKLWRERHCWNLHYRGGCGRASGVAGRRGNRPWNTTAIKVAERAGLSRQEARADDEYAVLLLETTR